MPLPNTMRYIAMREPGPPDVLIEATGPVPQPKPGEVLIAVAYAGVNRPDCLQRSGAYPPPADASPVVGLEVSGRIAALGEGVTAWQVGDEVCALTPGGGYAEYCTTPAGFCLPIPAGLSLRDAAGIPENYFTVWYNVFDRVKLAAGESILIHGGTSGIGLTAIQLAKAFGATVFTTAGILGLIGLSASPTAFRAQALPVWALFAASLRADDEDSQPALVLIMRSTTRCRISSRKSSGSRASEASTSCSTWSAATTSRGTSSAWRWRAGYRRSASSTDLAPMSACITSWSSG